MFQAPLVKSNITFNLHEFNPHVVIFSLKSMNEPLTSFSLEYLELTSGRTVKNGRDTTRGQDLLNRIYFTADAKKTGVYIVPPPFKLHYKFLYFFFFEHRFPK